MEIVDLPAGWSKAVVGDYFFLKNGFAFKSNDYIPASDKSYPVIRISDLDGKIATDSNAVHVLDGAPGFEVKNGDLLIAMSGATTGKIGIYQGKEPAYQNQRVGNLKLHSEVNGCNEYKNYLVYFLSDDILKIAYGGAQPNISGKAIEEMEVLLPPLAEQKVIAEKLGTLLAQVDNTKTRLERIPEILKRFRQSVLAAAVSGKLTEEWREAVNCGSVIEYLGILESERLKLVNAKKLKKSTLPRAAVEHIDSELPSSWACVNFEHIAAYDNNALKAGPFGSALKKSDCTDFGYRVYGQEQVIAGDENLVTYYINDEKFNDLSSCAVGAGDILVSLVGTIGKVLILSDNAEKGIINPRLVKLSLQPEVNRKYIQFYLQSIVALDFFKGFSHGGTMDILNLGILKDLPINFPPVQEQAEIVRRVDELFAFADRIEQAAQAALSRVNNLTQSILAKAFRGELTADWRAANPELISGENSAEALLARIKAERAKVKPIKKAKAR